MFADLFSRATRLIKGENSCNKNLTTSLKNQKFALAKHTCFPSFVSLDCEAHSRPFLCIKNLRGKTWLDCETFQLSIIPRQLLCKIFFGSFFALRNFDFMRDNQKMYCWAKQEYATVLCCKYSGIYVCTNRERVRSKSYHRKINTVIKCVIEVKRCARELSHVSFRSVRSGAIPLQMLLFPEMQTVVSTELANSPKSLNFEMRNLAAILFLDFSRKKIIQARSRLTGQRRIAFGRLNFLSGDNLART